MGKIEQLAKPHLLNLMFGIPSTFSEDDQRDIVNWIALKSMVFENNDRGDAVTSCWQRQQFMFDRTIPGNTQIWLFCCGAYPWDWSNHRHSASMATAPAGDRTLLENPALRPPGKNTHTLTVGILELLFFVYQSMTANIDFGFDARAARQVWPYQGDRLAWPPAYRADAGNADQVAGTLASTILDVAMVET
jgi:hypothetical protein